MNMKEIFIIIILIPSYIFMMDPLIKDLLTPVSQLGEKCGYASCPQIREGWINIHIVPHSHAELGYMNTFDEYYTGCDDLYDKSNINIKRMFDGTISELWADKTRKFTLSDSELPYFFHWWWRRHDTVRRMVYELIRQGRLMIVGGGWGMADEASTYYQSVIDSFTYSLRKINATFLACARPLVTWQADTFGHSREIASLIAQMGYDALFINPISYDDEIIRMERKGLEFVWRGSDDLGSVTDIYTHKLFDGYWSPPGFCFGSMCSDPLLITSDTVFINVDERVELFINSIKNRQAPYYNTNHVMVVMGQRLGYFDARMWFQNIDKLIDNVNKRTYRNGDKMHAMYSTPSCYLKTVFEESPLLETKQDDFFPFAYNKDSYASGMFTSRPTFKYFVREANIYLQISKQLQLLANLDNNDAIFEEFMWIMGVVQDHNIISGGMRAHVQSYYTKKLHLAVQGSTVVIGKALNKIRGSPSSTEYRLCYLNISSCPNTEVKMFYIIIYNPLAWSVTIPVRLPILNKRYDVFDPTGTKIKAVTMKIANHVTKIPKRRPKIKHELIFIAKNLPASGFRSYFIEESRIIREKKSLIKKINKNNQKKFFIRQVGKENLTFFDDDDDEYEYLDDRGNTKIEFGNISKSVANEKDTNIVTPKYTRIETSEATIESVTVSDTTMQVVNEVTEKVDNIIRDTLEENRIKDSYYCEESSDNFIKNEYIQINIDKYRKISAMKLSNNITTNLDVQFYYYVSDDPEKLGSKKRNPGAYIFRPMDKAEPIIDYIETKIYKSDVVEEIHSQYSDYTSFVAKLYKNRPIVEVDWIVGPVPIEDGLGKEVFIRYETDLDNHGVFYTDANGRQMVKRIKNKRALYEPYNLDPVAGNFYPVTSRIYIEDLKKNLRFSILNDRSQGGTSLIDGTLDLMIHRRILTDDNGIQTYLNETENGIGIIVRGTHYLYLTKANQNRLFEKKLAKEIEIKPQIMLSKISYTDKKTWISFRNEFSGVKKLPFGVHILTFDKWNNDLLLRLENYLEKADVSNLGIKKVFLKDIFVNINVKSADETVLSGHINLRDWAPLKWRVNGSFVRNFNDFYGNDKYEITNDASRINDESQLNDFNLNEAITLMPQQIRTFIIEYEYINKDYL